MADRLSGIGLTAHSNSPTKLKPMFESNQDKPKFTTIKIPTALLHETKLSIAAKMAAIVLLESPKSSNNIPTLLATTMNTSMTKAYEYLSELEDHGWLSRIELKDDRGRSTGYRYEILNAADKW